MTVDEMIQEVAAYMDETITKTGGAYVGDDLVNANRIVSAINYCKEKIVNEKFQPTYREDVTLDANKQFDVTTLAKTFKKVVKMLDPYDNLVTEWEWADTTHIELPYSNSGDVIDVLYGYIPADVSTSALTGTIDIPESIVSPKIYCCFAAWFYLNEENDDYSRVLSAHYLNLFNDGFDNIRLQRGESHRIIDVYGGI
jgi:hypothetical protein